MSNSPLARACPRCGSQLKTATLHGMRSIVCGRCDLVMVSRAELDAFAMRSAADFPTEDSATEEAARPGRPGRTSGRPPPERDLWGEYEYTAPPAKRGNTGLLVGAAVVVVTLVALLPAAWLGGQWWMRRSLPVEPAQAAVAAATPVIAAATPPAIEAPAPVEAPVVEAAPVVKAPSVRQIVARAWGEVDRGDAAKAEASFREALSARPTDAEATYGVGYALVRQDRVQEGRTWLCEALKLGPTVDTQREITGLLESKHLTCD